MINIELSRTYSFHQQGQRDYQEDSRYPNVDSADSGQRFFLVCDGVGGCHKGEVASLLVCEAFAESLETTDFSEDFTNDDFSKALNAAYDALDKNATDENREMATTLTFVCFHGAGCTMAHIGDSRIYQIRPSGGILYRSTDHSLVNSMVHNGVLTPEDALNSSQKHVIIRYMESVASDENRHMATVMRTDDVMAGDYFFLCSDGVLEMVDDDQLLSVLSKDDISDEDKMGILAQMCENSSDNNTAWLIPIAKVESDEIEGVAESNSGDSHNTRRMPINREGTMEIESVQDLPSSTKIWKWIKKVFN